MLELPFKWCLAVLTWNKCATDAQQNEKANCDGLRIAPTRNDSCELRAGGTAARRKGKQTHAAGSLTSVHNDFDACQIAWKKNITGLCSQCLSPSISVELGESAPRGHGERCAGSYHKNQRYSYAAAVRLRSSKYIGSPVPTPLSRSNCILNNNSGRTDFLTPGILTSTFSSN